MPWYNPTDPKQRNAGVVGIVLLALIYPYNQFYHSAQKEQLTLLQDSLAALEQENLTAQVLAARGGGQVEETLAEYERQVVKLEELIPSGQEVAVLLRQISDVSRLAGVRQQGLTPEIPESIGFYEREAYSMSVIGEYHSVARFLAEIASLPRIVTPLELNVELYQNPTQFPQFRSPVIADFRIEPYVLPEGGAPPPNAGAGPGGAS